MPEKPSAQAYAIGQQLRRVREARNLSMDQVSLRLSTADSPLSKAKLSRIEGGRSRIKPDDVRRLLDFYEAPPKMRRYLLEMTGLQSRRGSGFWREYPGHADHNVPQYLLLEQTAQWMGNMEPVLIPGLMQTREYGTEVMAAARQPDAPRVEREWLRREVRQQRLADGALIGQFLIGAPALTLEALPPRQRAEQLRKVLQCAALPNVSVRVIPNKVLGPATFGDQLVLLRFPDEGLPDVAYLEHFAGSWVVDDPETLQTCRDRYERVAAMCLSEDDSHELIGSALAGLPGVDDQPV